ncbi:unnamed protein product [Callosobruchus maculatus]|uniref:Uncharacterized protein n=1 Tax=Callosobruchus maculatus TaxID=64391 RepID=A0A653DRY7_CALMS|nr:unnamed protein product [Callosobruchus maculatus]
MLSTPVGETSSHDARRCQGDGACRRRPNSPETSSSFVRNCRLPHRVIVHLENYTAVNGQVSKA